MTPEPDAEVGRVQERQSLSAGERYRAAGARAAETEDRPGDPACWLRRVCPACGTLADVDPPTTCVQCRADIRAE
jgi:hypothetical protein